MPDVRSNTALRCMGLPIAAEEEAMTTPTDAELVREARMLASTGTNHSQLLAALAAAIERRRDNAIARAEAAEAQLTAERAARERMEKALGRVAIVEHVRMAYGGGTVPNGYGCKLCRAECGPGVAPLVHKPDCILARAALKERGGERSGSLGRPLPHVARCRG